MRRLLPIVACLAAFAAEAMDAGDSPLGMTVAELREKYKPFACPAVPTDPALQFCSYFPPPESHRHLRVPALDSFAGFPVSMCSFTLRHSRVVELTLTFESRGREGGRTIDPRKLVAALDERFGKPASRKTGSIGRPPGIETLETTWNAGAEKLTLMTYPAGGINVTLKRAR